MPTLHMQPSSTSDCVLTKEVGAKINSLSSQHDNASFCFKATCGDVSFSSSLFRVVSKTSSKRKAAEESDASRKRKAAEESDAASNCNTDDLSSTELNKEELVDALDFLEHLRDDDSSSLHSLSMPICHCSNSECALYMVNQSLQRVNASMLRIEALLKSRS